MFSLARRMLVRPCHTLTSMRSRLASLMLMAATGFACSEAGSDPAGNTALSGAALTVTGSSAGGAGTVGTTTQTSSSMGAATTGSASSGGVVSGGMTGTGSSTMTGAAQTSGSTQTTGGMGSGGTTGSGTTGSTTSGAGGSTGSVTSAGGMGGTGGSNPGFQPCPEAEPCKILPLGDSITVGLGYDGGYRVELFRLALGDGHEVTFTGTQAPNGPNMVDGMPFPRNHEGISGQTIQQIDGRIPSPGLNEMPHIILVHAGTNDMNQNANGADARLGALMDDLIAEAPDALIVVSNIIPLPFAANAVDSFNATVPGMVEERANAGAHIIFADQFTGFPESELGDGVHPNQAGYERMARVWYEAISAYLR